MWDRIIASVSEVIVSVSTAHVSGRKSGKTSFNCILPNKKIRQLRSLHWNVCLYHVRRFPLFKLWPNVKSIIRQPQRLAELADTASWNSCNLRMNLKVNQLLIFIIGSLCRPHLLTPGFPKGPLCALPPTLSIPPHIIVASMSLAGACFGMEKENMTYLAAVTTLRGEAGHNKNNQLSFDRNPRFQRTYTTLGGMKEERGGETFGLKDGRGADWN